ncbi:MAG: POTRA domain-containing protein, partial [Bacteroidota bacterium]
MLRRHLTYITGHRLTRHTFVCVFSLAILFVRISRCPAQVQATIAEFEIQSIDFEGNDTFSSNELLSLMQTQVTPGFLNKFLYNSISERLGRKNEYLDGNILDDDVSRLRQFYNDHGFQDVRVDTSLTFSRQDTTVEILIRIQEGYRSLIDTLTYKGIINVPDIVNEEVSADPKIVKGDPFNKILIEEEVKRVLQILKNDGYARATFVRDSSSMTYYTSTRNYSVLLCFDLGKLYRFGDITVQQEQDPIRDDINDEDLLHQLDYKKGEVYSLENLTVSEKNLNRIGIFDRAWIETRFPNSDRPESIFVATNVKVRPRDKHELAPEILFSSDDNNNFTFGAGLGYTNRNFLGGGRTFSTRLRFRTQNFRAFPDVFNANNNAIA